MSMDKLANSFKGFDPDNLDFSQAGNWPVGVKVLCYLIVFGAVIAGGVYLHISDAEKRLNTEISTEVELKQKVQAKAGQVANLDALRKQMADVQGQFTELLKQLPTEKEVPGLLEDISEIGRSSGLDIQVIQLAAEQKNQFYIELPIDIQVTGAYHQLGQFVSGVAALSRIVTLHDYRIAPGGNSLSMNISAKTYRYDDSN